MFKYFGIVIVLNSAIADVDFNYNYEEYTDDGYALNGEDYVYNDWVVKAKPNRAELIMMDNVINDTVNTSPTKTRSRSTRDCNYSNNLDAATLPAPKVGDGKSTYSYAASVLKTGSHYASGALVHKRWVLTAAGGFYNVRESIKLFRVRLGSVNCKKGGLLLPLQQITIHPGFSPGLPEYDLAMIRLAKPVKYTQFIHPVSLTKMRIETPKFLTVYWPRIIVNGKPLPESAKERKYHSNLRVSTQQLMSKEKCSKALISRQAMINEHSFCMWPLKQHHSMCMPDTGAPVVAHDGLWGIISGWVAQPCTHSNPSPVVVTRVSPAAVREWLAMQMEHE